MMDPAKTPLGQMLLDEITPVVMVLSTSSVEEACLKNGLSFLQMLTPFSSFNNIDVPVRTASDQPYRLQKFKLRLYYASAVRKPDLEVAKEHLRQVITEAGEKQFSELSLDTPEINHVLENYQSGNAPSWLRFFNKELIRAVSFSEHEAFDHPVACLLAVSSKDEQPINRFIDLFNTNKLPSLLNDGVMDPKILKHYLLVHDNQDGPADRATKILTEMRSTFGTSDCALLCINSSTDAPVKHEENPWASYNSDVSPGQDLGFFLNTDDITMIKDLMQDFSSKHIIPSMEQKIRVLNQQVSATRKGFRNQIKNLWWRKGKEDGTDSANGPMYGFSSTESQIRVLGDYAFMLKDYELALSNYRLISTDYKLDKAWKRYAGVQEMMGLAYFMLDQSRKEAEYCMENAFTTYLKLGSSGQQNATRCGLWWIEMLKARDLYKEAAPIYFRICGEDILHSAVMLEQASYCYSSKPSMLRKFGFHLVLSGDRYNKCDQVKHAIRTYRSALSVFSRTTWSHIKDHVHFHIGQWYASLGMCDVAVKHMLEILACGHQSKTTQELFLGDFLQIVQKTGRTFEVSRLQLPVINTSSLKVVFEDHRTFGSPSAANTRENLWRSLEEEIIPSFSSTKTNWLELQSKLISKKYRESNVCVAGEAVKVNVEFKNPLQIPIPVSGVTLICKHFPSTVEVKSDEHISRRENDNAGKYEELTACRDMSSENSFLASEVDFLLRGGETTMVFYFLNKAGCNVKIEPTSYSFYFLVFIKLSLVRKVNQCLLRDEIFCAAFHSSWPGEDESLSSSLESAGMILGTFGRPLQKIAFFTCFEIGLCIWFLYCAFDLVQLSVTPREEGTLEVIGVRWKLLGSIVGFHNFDFNHVKKDTLKGKRKGKPSTNEHLEFLVIKSIPKLQGSIHPFPDKGHVGDLWHLVLELRNPSEFPVKNLKMKISHPRFLNIGNQESMESELPACLMKKVDSLPNGANANPFNMSDTVFMFPEGTSVQGATPFAWPLWFRAAFPGNISLYISIYYEIGDTSSVIKYRILRLQYNLQVLPSLDVSFQISPSPLRLKEFLVRMDVVNKTASEDFLVNQLSSIGSDWEISLLQPADTIFPSQSLKAGQAVSCFLTLKNCRSLLTAKDNISLVPRPVKNDIILLPQGGDDSVYDVSSEPLVNFHHYERLQQELQHEAERDLNTVDFVLISRPLQSNSNAGFVGPPLVMSHYACHCSTASSGPISWLLDGPRTLHHNFSASFSEINLKMHLHNSSDATAFVRITTSDSAINGGHLNSANTALSESSSDDQGGWRHVTPANEVKVTSNISGGQPAKPLSLGSVSPYIWSGSSSNNIRLESMSSAEIPLQICVFSPGIYDLSNYILHWNLLLAEGQGDQDEMRRQSGKCLGYTYYLTVLQST